MGIWAWLILLAASAALATAAQFLFFAQDRGPKDFDWVYVAGGGLLGSFTAHVWYPVGPTIDGLYVAPALGGLIVGAALVEIVYRMVLRPRQT